MRKPVFKDSDQDTHQPVQSLIKARILNFQIYVEEELYCLVKTEALISCAVDQRLCFRLGKSQFLELLFC